jgi:hypothetical protein
MDPVIRPELPRHTEPNDRWMDRHAISTKKASDFGRIGVRAFREPEFSEEGLYPDALRFQLRAVNIFANCFSHFSGEIRR